MITLDALRSALRDPKPWTALDALVRSEQAAGRKVREIHDDLWALVEPVRAAENPPEDADDAMMDTLDALAGNCRSEDCYTDPPRSDLPTEEEIAKLPRWARVAFAARCARRAVQFLDTDTRFLSAGHYTAALDAISAAESEAIVGYHSPFRVDLVNWVEQLRHNNSQPELVLRLASIARCVLDSLEAEHWIVNPSSSHGRSGAVRSTYATQALALSMPTTAVDFRVSIRRDFEKLLRLSMHHFWTDDTPVPPDVFGPLWPEGPPPGWPADPDVPHRTELALSFLAADHPRRPDALEDEVVNLFNALNAYHIARTGRRLTLDGDVFTLLAARVQAGV